MLFSTFRLGPAATSNPTPSPRLTFSLGMYNTFHIKLVNQMLSDGSEILSHTESDSPGSLSTGDPLESFKYDVLNNYPSEWDDKEEFAAWLRREQAENGITPMSGEE